MTDVTAPLASPSAAEIGAASRARVRARYRAEARFRLYGALAIGLTALFLLVLIVDILAKGLPAFWHHSLVLEVPVTAEEVAPEGTRSNEMLRVAEQL